MIKKYIVIMLMFILVTSVFSVHADAFNINDTILLAKEEPKEEEESSGGSYDELMRDRIHASYTDTTSLSGNVSDFLTTLVVGTKIIGVAVAIIILLVLATKYVVAAPGERADIKKSAIPYVIGAFVLFATAGILSLIQGVAEILDVGPAGEVEQ